MGANRYIAPELWRYSRPSRVPQGIRHVRLRQVAAEIFSARSVEGARAQPANSDGRMQTGGFDVRFWAAEYLREPVARCLLLVADSCRRREVRARPDMPSVAAALFARSPGASSRGADRASDAAGASVGASSRGAAHARGAAGASGDASLSHCRATRLHLVL
jgi:hypothetical protein